MWLSVVYLRTRKGYYFCFCESMILSRVSRNVSRIKIRALINARRYEIRRLNGLAEACQIVNSRPYQQDSDLCPLNLAYPNSEIPDPDRQTSNITELTEAAEMAHLTSVEPDTLPEYQERSNIRRKRQLKAYEYLFNKSRREIKERLSRTLPAATHALQPGSYARYYRPTLSKVKARWSPPCMIIDAKSSTTRVIRKPDGTHSTEWIGNLTPAPAPPLVFRNGIREKFPSTINS